MPQHCLTVGSHPVLSPDSPIAAPREQFQVDITKKKISKQLCLFIHTDSRNPHHNSGKRSKDLVYTLDEEAELHRGGSVKVLQLALSLLSE